MTHEQILKFVKSAISDLTSDTSVPASQTKGELLDLIDDMQCSADAIEVDPDED